MKHMLKSAKLTKNELVNPITKELEYFLACADAGSILRASEKLGIQQAGLSKVIQKLESEIEQKLFYRRSRGIELTEYGHGLRKALINTKTFWTGSYSDELNRQLGPTGTIKIGCHASVAANILPQFIEKLILNYPNIKLETEFHSSMEITRKVAELQIDIGIVANAVKNQELVIRRLKGEHVAVWCCQKEHERVLLYNPVMIESGNLLKKYKNYRLVPMPDYEVIASIVQQTAFLGLLPNPVAERHGLQQHGEKLMNVNLSLVWHKDRFRGSTKVELVNLIIDSVT